MFCENCGAELQQKDNKLVCPKCGAEYPAQSSANAAQPSVETVSEYITPRGFSSKKNIIIIILAAVLVLGLGAGITVLAVTNSPSYKVSQGIELAERYLSEQNYEQAIIEYEKVLEIEPMNVDAYLGLAEAYKKMGEIDKAIEVLREGLEMTGDERIKKRLNKLLNPEESSSSSSSSAPAESSTPDGSTPEDLPPYGSMGSVTIQGTEYDIATITELELVEKNVTDDDVAEIGKLTNLTYLDLGYNQISDITPISNLSNLTELHLRFNQINDLSPLVNLTNLTNLDLDTNQIYDVSPLANLTNLTSLDLDSNQIDDITPFVNLKNLTRLCLGHNEIHDITPLSNLTNLTQLYLGKNEISDISSLVNLKKLTILRLLGDQISDITPLANLTNLETLWLDSNPISEEDINWLKTKLPNCEISYSDYTGNPSDTPSSPEENDISPELPLEVEWAAEPTYKYDDVVMLKSNANYFVKSLTLYDDFNGDCGNTSEAGGLYITEKNDKMGLVDSSGNEIVEPQFDSIYKDAVIMFTNNNNPSIQYTLDTHYNLTTIMRAIGGPGEHAYLMNYYDNSVYNVDYTFSPYSYGKMSSTKVGTKIVLGAYFVPNDNNFFSDEEMKEILNNNTYGYGLYANGKLVVPTEFDTPSIDVFNDRFVGNSTKDKCVFKKNNKIYIYDLNGKCLSDGVYDNVANCAQEEVYFDGHLTVCRNGKWGLIDENCKEVVKCQFEDISAVYEGNAWVKLNGKWGVIKITD